MFVMPSINREIVYHSQKKKHHTSGSSSIEWSDPSALDLTFCHLWTILSANRASILGTSSTEFSSAVIFYIEKYKWSSLT